MLVQHCYHDRQHKQLVECSKALVRFIEEELEFRKAQIKEEQGDM